MENALLIGLSRQTALMRSLEISAHNLANMSTVAYKAERPLFKTFLTDIRDTSGRPDTAKYTTDFGMARDTAEGATRRTGNPLDVAIKGQGYFVIETAAGERYTRNGHLRLNDQGELVTADGDRVLDTARAPISFAPEEENIAIARDGSISTSQGAKSRLLIVEFDNEALLERSGGSLYRLTEPQEPKPAAETNLQQGVIEESNVVPILEMTNMVEISRAYATATQLVKSIEDVTERAIRQLSDPR